MAVSTTPEAGGVPSAGGMIGRAVWGVAAYLMSAAMKLPDPQALPKTRKMTSPVSPAIPLRVCMARPQQFERDNAWIKYHNDLIEYGSVTEAAVILSKLHEFWETENPTIEIPVEAHEAREYVEGEYVPPPPTEQSVNPMDCYHQDCKAWNKCLSTGGGDRCPLAPEEAEPASDETLVELGVINEPPEISALILLLNDLNASEVLTWSMTYDRDRKRYPDGRCWKISTKVGKDGRTTSTRWASTHQAQQFATDCLAELGGGDEANPEADERKAA